MNTLTCTSTIAFNFKCKGVIVETNFVTEFEYHISLVHVRAFDLSRVFAKWYLQF